MKTIKLLIQNSDGLAFVVAVMTIISTYYLTRRTSSQEFVKEQYDKLISPMFFLLEPYLFQNMDNAPLEKVFNLIDENKSLVDGRLLEIAYYSKNYPSQDNYNILCSYVNKAYDNSCKRLGLKTRSIEYRLVRKQYKSRISLFLYLAFLLIKSLLIFVSFAFVVLGFLGIALYYYENTSDPYIKLIFTIVGAFILYAFIKYIEKDY